jgi:hypothetical protein
MSEELGMDLQKENIGVVVNRIKAATRGIYYIVMGETSASSSSIEEGFYTILHNTEELKKYIQVIARLLNSAGNTTKLTGKCRAYIDSNISKIIEEFVSANKGYDEVKHVSDLIKGVCIQYLLIAGINPIIKFESVDLDSNCTNEELELLADYIMNTPALKIDYSKSKGSGLFESFAEEFVEDSTYTRVGDYNTVKSISDTIVYLFESKAVSKVSEPKWVAEGVSNLVSDNDLGDIAMIAELTKRALSTSILNDCNEFAKKKSNVFVETYLVYIFNKFIKDGRAEIELLHDYYNLRKHIEQVCIAMSK